MSSSVTDAAAPVREEERQGSLVLLIDRPHAGNSISLETAQALAAGLNGARNRADLKGIVIAGAGGKFFCAGGDLKAYRALRTREELAATFGVVRDLLLAMEAHPLPVVAAIDGFALGGGAEMALACDLRFASSGATIGFPQSRLGLIPGWNGTERLVARVGRAAALRLLLEARRLTAADALRIGLVDEVSDGDALAHALDYLERLDAAPLALRGAKAAVQACRPPGAFDTSSTIFEALWFTDDHREAELAFVEKREPVFSGR